jgi:hypothetical protein
MRELPLVARGDGHCCHRLSRQPLTRLSCPSHYIICELGHSEAWKFEKAESTLSCTPFIYISMDFFLLYQRYVSISNFLFRTYYEARSQG